MVQKRESESGGGEGEKRIDEIRIRTFILMLLFFCRFQKCFRRHFKKIRFLLFTVHSVGTLLSLRYGVCLFLLSLLYFIVVYSRRIHNHHQKNKKKNARENILSCDDKKQTHMLFDLISSLKVFTSVPVVIQEM